MISPVKVLAPHTKRMIHTFASLSEAEPPAHIQMRSSQITRLPMVGLPKELMVPAAKTAPSTPAKADSEGGDEDDASEEAAAAAAAEAAAVAAAATGVGDVYDGTPVQATLSWLQRSRQ